MYHTCLAVKPPRTIKCVETVRRLLGRSEGGGCEIRRSEMSKLKIKPTAAKADAEEAETTEEGEVEKETSEPPWSMSVPAAGRKYYNLGKKASYDNTGPPGSGALIPCVQAGRLLRALPPPIPKPLPAQHHQHL